MDQNIAMKLRASIKKHEGFKKFAYTDTTGNLTIGYGRNISAVGISETEGEILLGDDIVNATAELYRFIPWSQDLDDVRKAVMIEMNFNMGIEKLLKFKQMLEALKAKNYKLAAEEMLDSEWSKEVHGRSQDLSYAMEMGVL